MAVREAKEAIVSLSTTDLPTAPSCPPWCAGHADGDLSPEGWTDVEPGGVYKRCQLEIAAGVWLQQFASLRWRGDDDEPWTHAADTAVELDEPRIRIELVDEFDLDAAEELAAAILRALRAVDTVTTSGSEMPVHQVSDDLLQAFEEYVETRDIDPAAYVHCGRPLDDATLLEALKDCTDVMPNLLCADLDLPAGSTYGDGAAVRFLVRYGNGPGWVWPHWRGEHDRSACPRCGLASVGRGADVSATVDG